MKAKFIVIEGLEGAGKSTAVSVVKAWIEAHRSAKVLVTREPGGTPMAEKLRTLIKAPTEPEVEPEFIVSTTELLLMYAARVQLVENVIKPSLKQGVWVIGDRHELSTRAYQGGGRGINHKTLQTLSDICLDTFKPDITLYLDILPSVGFERIQVRGYKDRIEQEDLSFFERVRQGYLEAINESMDKHADKPICLIDASQKLEQVHADIIMALERYL